MMKKVLYSFGMLIVITGLIYTFAPADILFKLAISAERKVAGLSVKTVNIDEGLVSYLEGGTGETLILLHGFGANKDSWNRLARNLSDDYHIIALDLPGFGDSFKPMTLDYDVDSQTKRLDEFINKLKLTQFHIAGNSLGGYIAGNYAALFSDNVRSLWLLNPLGVVSAPDSQMFEMIKQKKRPIVLAKDLSEYQELISYVFYQPPFLPDFFIVESAKQAQRDFPIHSKIFENIHHSADFEINLSSPLDIALKDFPKPVLITWGDKDRILHHDGAKVLASLIPNAKIQLMENMGHLPMMEAPTITADQFILFTRDIR
jgi:abhydrolase domain-containing protein 6